jgi:hypothetical protein
MTIKTPKTYKNELLGTLGFTWVKAISFPKLGAQNMKS